MNTDSLGDDIATYTSMLRYIQTDAKGRKETSTTDSTSKQAMSGAKYNDGNGRVDKDRKHNTLVRLLTSSTPRTSRGITTRNTSTSTKKRPHEDVDSSSDKPSLDKYIEFNALVDELRSFRDNKFIDFATDKGTNTTSDHYNLLCFFLLLPLTTLYYHCWY